MVEGRGAEPAGRARGRTILTFALSVAVALFIVWLAADVLLLAFAGVLLAVLLRGLAVFVRDRLRIGDAWALALALATLLAIMGLSAAFLMPKIAVQADALVARLPAAIERATAVLEDYAWGRYLLERDGLISSVLPRRSDVFARATGVVSTTFGAVTDVVVVVFVGIYLAASPAAYTTGIARLFRPRDRPRVLEVLAAIGATLRRWVVGRCLLMAANGAATAAGLWALGVPLATTLGILAGLLNFVPNVGPLIAAVPALLLALTIGPATALAVLALYVVLQSLDGYVFTPLVQRRTVALPPAVTILAQVSLGALFGGLGVLLATPIAAASLVLVKMVYVEGVLGERTSPPETSRET